MFLFRQTQIFEFHKSHELYVFEIFQSVQKDFPARISNSKKSRVWAEARNVDVIQRRAVVRPIRVHCSSLDVNQTQRILLMLRKTHQKLNEKSNWTLFMILPVKNQFEFLNFLRQPYSDGLLWLFGLLLASDFTKSVSKCAGKHRS